MSGGRRFLVFRLPLVLYLALIFFFSSGPVTTPALKEIADYYLHAIEYCVLYFLMFWALHEGLQRKAGRGGYWLAALLTVLYGISDEFHQRFVPTRDASFADVGADAIGALLGTLLLAGFKKAISFFRPQGIA